MTAAHDLHAIITTWPELADALTTQQGDTWPPAGRMTTHIRDRGLDDTPQRGARDGSGTGESPAPCRIDILDTMQAVHGQLLDCADVVAEVVQVAPTGDELARLRSARDPRRWRWTGRRPQAQYAALWLYGRVTGAAGPFRPLPDRARLLIEATGRDALSRIERALQLTRLSAAVDLPCSCGGEIRLHGGDGALPHLICSACGRYYSGQLAA
ncbi:hypothetical protein OOK13_40355 [Streptomyces sp. NBC_00378]|uniref:hypothetical protein n=1 Tax=unclassified Streptomyces TaxID=2593676 RepID=UPI0022563278|nr:MULTISPECIES: hypothetical protein [unclassified Streptomyces]MCX5112190.1 hypothetical protein [Streptomyces sp. NBC_00378]MCX5114615.1 hypothetical protein [Streptomyces sp. NBC_00378]